ncbi:esterase/lipase family protein, partial [Chromohalobacter nigrandesensis]|uniref:esterase/lipase family protein n=1 Tax=Chromohalobacter nigrandesensis TaxID=119863 RepID=UPI001FF6C17B
DSEFDALQPHLADYYRRVAGLSADAAESRAEANVHTLGRFNFPVHACGYNWLQSNTESAATLAKRVDEIIAGYRKARMTCNQAILVTHSMGGLVARYYSEVVGGRDDLLGIVHGVMPTAGAPVFYRRIKAGTASEPFNLTSWATSKILGASAREMTAVLAQSPGPLQLVPTPDYGRGWLRIEKEGHETVALPTGDDPYTDIYLDREHWWGMMEPALAMPELEAGAKDRQGKLDEAWKSYAELVASDVAKFHAGLAGEFHPNTYLFYADSDAHMSYGTVAWQGRAMTYGADPVMTTKLNDQYGEHRVVTERNARGTPELYRYTLSEADDPGDGTVPERSGSKGADQARESLTVSTGHEAAYNHESARLFTLASILEIAGTMP